MRAMTKPIGGGSMRPLLFASALALSFTAVRAEAASIALQPAAQIVSPGDSVVLDLMASGFGAAVLGDYDLDISFDPTVLTLGSFAVSGALGSIAGGEALDFSVGVVSPGLLNLSVISTLTAAQLDVLQGASFSLASLGFTVGPLAPGSSTVVAIAAVNAFGDGSGSRLTIDGLQSASLAGPAGPPGTTPVPEPTTWILCASGLAALGRNRLRRTSPR
jgi:hypothetical protein